MNLPLVQLASLCQAKVIDNPACTPAERERAMKLIERLASLSTVEGGYLAQLQAENQMEATRREMADFLSVF